MGCNGSRCIFEKARAEWLASADRYSLRRTGLRPLKQGVTFTRRFPDLFFRSESKLNTSVIISYSDYSFGLREYSFGIIRLVTASWRTGFECDPRAGQSPRTGSQALCLQFCVMFGTLTIAPPWGRCKDGARVYSAPILAIRLSPDCKWGSRLATHLAP